MNAGLVIKYYQESDFINSIAKYLFKYLCSSENPKIPLYGQQQ